MAAELHAWLHAAGLGKYEAVLAENEFDRVDSLVNMTEADLIEMGITKVGARRKFMTAVSRERSSERGRSQSPLPMSAAGTMTPETCSRPSTPGSRLGESSRHQSPLPNYPEAHTLPPSVPGEILAHPRSIPLHHDLSLPPLTRPETLPAMRCGSHHSPAVSPPQGQQSERVVVPSPSPTKGQRTSMPRTVDGDRPNLAQHIPLQPLGKATPLPARPNSAPRVPTKTHWLQPMDTPVPRPQGRGVATMTLSETAELEAAAYPQQQQDAPMGSSPPPPTPEKTHAIQKRESPTKQKATPLAVALLNRTRPNQSCPAAPIRDDSVYLDHVLLDLDKIQQQREQALEKPLTPATKGIALMETDHAEMSTKDKLIDFTTSDNSSLEHAATEAQAVLDQTKEADPFYDTLRRFTHGSPLLACANEALYGRRVAQIMSNTNQANKDECGRDGSPLPTGDSLIFYEENLQASDHMCTPVPNQMNYTQLIVEQEEAHLKLENSDKKYKTMLADFYAWQDSLFNNLTEFGSDEQRHLFSPDPQEPDQ